MCADPRSRRDRSPSPSHPRVPCALAAFALAALAPLAARADAPSLFGFGARAAGLARAGVAQGDAGAAARENPATASAPGLRVRLGYGFGSVKLAFNDRDAGVPRASGLDLAAQYGADVGRGFELGFALGLHIPDTSLARVLFRPATEPQFPLYEAPLQRTSFDAVLAARYGPLSIGGGLSAGLSVGGEGTQFTLAQDARGSGADGRVDVTLPYRFAPVIGARADLGRFAFGATFRGAMGLDLTIDNKARVDLVGNPLNGDIRVRVSGTAGYDPAVITVGTRVRLTGGLSALASLEYAVWSAAPPPIADVRIDLALGTNPGLREVRFPEPRFRDILVPRFGLELMRPSAAEWRWAARLGYALSPSPVPRQTGLTTYADSTRHQIAFGGGYRFARVGGVTLSLEAAGQIHVLTARTEDKASPALPWAHQEMSGRIYYGSLTLEAMF